MPDEQNERQARRLSSRESVRLGLCSAALKRVGFIVGPFIANAHGEVSGLLQPELCEFLSDLYTDKEQLALVNYCADSLMVIDFDAEERIFLSNLLRYCENKSFLFQFLLDEMESRYCLRKMHHQSNTRAISYIYSSLQIQPSSVEFLKNRVRKVELMVPFFIDLCSHGFLLLNLVTIIGVQLTELVDQLVDIPNADISDKKTLARMYAELAEVDFDHQERQRFKKSAQKLNCPVVKKIKFDASEL